MEEVWKEIDLSSLLEHSSSRPGARSGSGSGHAVDPTSISSFHCGSGPGCDVSLQDFLARPFHKEPASFPSPRRPSSSESLLGLASCNTADPPPQKTQTQRRTLQPPRGCTQAAAAVPPSSSFIASKDDEEEHPEQRRKRLMKCRESAARTRSKKQAHMSELEMELNHLQQENAKLRRQYLELRMAVSALAPVKQQQRHRRTLTAPF